MSHAYVIRYTWSCQPWAASGISYFHSRPDIPGMVWQKAPSQDLISRLLEEAQACEKPRSREHPGLIPRKYRRDVQIGEFVSGAILLSCEIRKVNLQETEV
jgi:hypothetical protein